MHVETCRFAHVSGCDAVMWNVSYLFLGLSDLDRNETKRNRNKQTFFLSDLCVAVMICSRLRFVSLSFDKCMCFVKWIAEGF